MKERIIALVTVVILSFSSVGVQAATKEDYNYTKNSSVVITKIDNHYEVTLNYNSGKSRGEIGRDYGREIKKVLPNYEEIMDSYLGEITGDERNYRLCVSRANDIKPQLMDDYIAEIKGLASAFSGEVDSIPGDGKIGENEMFVMNLLTDVARSYECSALSVYGDKAEGNSTKTVRVLDWLLGSKGQLADIHTITTFKSGESSIATIGFLGYMGVITGFNDNSVFAGILDGGNGREYNSKDKRSYVFDIRYALERYNSVEEVGNYLKDSNRKYTFSHMIMLSDKNGSKVLENNMHPDYVRDFRTDKSELNPGVEWGFDNAVGVVNAYMLKGNIDTYTNFVWNRVRWESMRQELAQKGDKVSLDELKEIASYSKNPIPALQGRGNLYNVNTVQIITFEPETQDLQVYFKQKNHNINVKPIFEKIQVSF